MPPQGTDLVLTTDVPHRERDVFVFDRLDVEACRGLAFRSVNAQETERSLGVCIRPCTTTPSGARSHLRLA